jgi:hypothetical protein
MKRLVVSVMGYSFCVRIVPALCAMARGGRRSA